VWVDGHYIHLSLTLTYTHSQNMKGICWTIKPKAVDLDAREGVVFFC